jgi:hypothetical protein
LLALDIILAQRHGQHRIAAQVIVVIQILVAQCQPEDALRNEIQQRVFDLIGLAVVFNANTPPSEVMSPPSKRQTNSRPPNCCGAPAACARGWNRRGVSSGVMTSPMPIKTPGEPQK